jgi:hypothetical protein
MKFKTYSVQIGDDGRWAEFDSYDEACGRARRLSREFGQARLAKHEARLFERWEDGARVSGDAR